MNQLRHFIKDTHSKNDEEWQEDYDFLKELGYTDKQLSKMDNAQLKRTAALHKAMPTLRPPYKKFRDTP